jgi:hypothetical protein
VKKLIWPVVVKLGKFDAIPNHCILYWGKEYEKLTSYPLCGASSYNRNVGCHVHADDEVTLRRGPKKKEGVKKSTAVKHISSKKDEEEEGYM